MCFQKPYTESFKTRSSCPEMFCKKGVLKNFTKLTGKHLCQSQACNITTEVLFVTAEFELGVNISGC